VFQVDIAALFKLTSFRYERWGHDRVQADFNRRVIRDQKRFSASMRFVHNDLMGRRHTADYSPQHLNSRAAERCLSKAADMVLSIAEV
jgi:hypothetical protein